MNWNSHEFIWLDWTILAVGIVAVIWAVWRSVQKDKRSQQGASSDISVYLYNKTKEFREVKFKSYIFAC
jgi:SSS family solute:Na+ symporter